MVLRLTENIILEIKTDPLLVGIRTEQNLNGGVTMNDSISQIAIDAITIIHHLGQEDLAKILLDRYDKVIKNG